MDVDSICKHCGASGWAPAESNGYSVADYCRCATGQRMKAARKASKIPPPEKAEPVLTSEQALGLVGMMAGDMTFFPGEELARNSIADELRQLCQSFQDGEWLVRRMRHLFTKWPGTRTMRTVYCSARRPLAGPDLGLQMIEEYPDGLSPERELPPPPALKALPPGHVASASPSIDAALRDIAKLKDLNRLGLSAPKVPDIPAVRITDANRITQADIDRAVAEHRAKAEAGRRELEIPEAH